MPDLVPLALRVGVIWWLLLCARQDLHTRHIANWLTLPPFLAAVPLSLVLAGVDGMLFCLLVIACSYVIWRDGSLGAADAKMAGFLAAVAPATLLFAVVALWAMFGVEWIRSHRRQNLSLPGAVGLFAGGISLEVWQWLRATHGSLPPI